MAVSTRLVSLAAGALLSLPALGCGFFRDAEISSMVPGGNLMTGHLECWLELLFDGSPDGDPRDVVVEFSSIVMPEPQRFDWDFIAAHDLVRKGDFKGYRENTESSPGDPPPLATPLRVKFPLKALDRLRIDPGDKLELTATLYWAGAKQDSHSRTLHHVYTKEGAPL